MPAVQQPVYGRVLSLAACVESIVVAKQSQTAGGASIGDGMAQSGVAVAARAAFLSDLALYLTADLDHVTANATTYYRAATPLVLWGGIGTLFCETATDTFSRVVNDTVTPGTGRFNTSANAAGNWYEAARTFKIALTETRNAFTCYVTNAATAIVSFEFLYNDNVLKTVLLPVAAADRPAANEALAFCYADGNVLFNSIRVNIAQATATEASFERIGFDDFAIGFVRACTVPESEMFTVFARNSPQFASDLNAIAPTAGAAFNARQAFLAHLTSSTVETFESKTANGGEVYSGVWYDQSNPLSMFGGAGTLTQADTLADGGFDDTTGKIMRRALPTNLSSSSGRWNTTPGGRQYWESPRRFNLNFTSPQKVLFFYCTDLLDFLAGYLELQFFLGTTLVHREIVAGEFLTAPFRDNGVAFYGKAFKTATFDQVRFVIAQTTDFPGEEDWQGFDDFGIGVPAASMFTQPNAQRKPTKYAYYGYGRRYTFDLSDIVYAPFGTSAPWPHEAKQSRDDFFSQTTTPATLTFESLSVGAIAPGTPLTTTLPAPLSAVTVSISTTTADTAIATSSASTTWNTTPGGSQLLLFRGSVSFAFSAPIRSLGFYLLNRNKKPPLAQLRTLLLTFTKVGGGVDKFLLPTLYGSVGTLAGTSADGNDGGGVEHWGIVGATQYTGVLIEVINAVAPAYYDLEGADTVAVDPSFVDIGLDDLVVGV